MRTLHPFFFLGVLASICACGGTLETGSNLLADGGSPGSSTAQEANVAGTWSGRFLSVTGARGGATLQLTQIGAHVSGTVTYVTSPCAAWAQSNVFSGDLNGNDLAAKVSSGAMFANLEATVDGTSMTGTYQIINGGSCSADSGTFSFTR